MALVLSCPSCGRQLRVPDELLGSRVQCPSCSTTFDAAAAASGGALPAVSPADAAEVDDRPWERPDDGHVRRDSEPHRASTVLTLGILGVALLPCCGVGLALAIPALIMGSGDLRKMRANVM